jgi:hypothetical protein
MKNLNLLLKKLPKLSLRILHQEVKSKSQSETVEDAKERFNEIKLDKVCLVFQIGIGKGLIYQFLKPWLRKSSKNALYFVEDRLEALVDLLNQPHAEEILKDDSVNIIFLEGKLSETFSIYHFPAFEDFASKSIITTQYYKKNRPIFVEELRHFINREILKRYHFLSEHLHLSKDVYHSFYQNLKNLHSFVDGTALEDKLHNIPVILCGAGPSLKKQCPLIKKMKNKALIVAGGGAMGVLSKAGIIPHLSIAIDPSSCERERLWKSNGFETPLLFRLRLNGDAVELVHGLRLFFNGSTGYHTSDWIEKKFAIEASKKEEGFSCITFALSLLLKFGTRPIIFTGMDLALSGGEEYSPGVGHPFVSETSKKGLEWDSEELSSDIYGNPIRTKWKWLAESAWISDFSKKTHIINCTEGGIGFESIENKTLESVLNTLPQRDLYSYMHVHLLKCKQQNICIKNEVTNLKDSFFNSLHYVESILDKLYEHKFNNLDIKEVDSFGDRFSLIDIFLQEEESYQYFLKTLDFILKNMHKYLLEREEPKGTLLNRSVSHLARDIQRFQTLQFAILFHLEKMNILNN